MQPQSFVELWADIKSPQDTVEPAGENSRRPREERVGFSGPASVTPNIGVLPHRITSRPSVVRPSVRQCCHGPVFNIRLIEYSVKGIFGEMNISPAILFPALAHDTRLRCLLLLLAHEELCVCELTHAIGAAQPHMSRHLGQLREAGLVTDRREGLWIHYRINPQLPGWVRHVLEETARGVSGTAPYENDRAALTDMPNRPGVARCA